MFILLLFDSMFLYACQVHLFYHFTQVFWFLIDFSLWMIYSFLKTRYWSFLVLLYCCIFLFSVFNVCFIYLGPPFWGAYIFIIVISLWFNDLFSLYSDFLCVLWQILTENLFSSDINIATLAFFWLLFACNIFFPSLPCQAMCILKLEQVSCKHNMFEYFTYIQPLCVF